MTESEIPQDIDLAAPEPETPPENAAAPVEPESHPGSTLPRKPLFIIAAVVAVLVLAGAAFMAFRLFSAGQVTERGGKDGELSLSSKGGPGGKASTIKLEMDPAPELPKQRSQANGLISSLTDNGFMMQSGGKIQISADADGNVTANSDGPTVEVVITKDTLIYRDTTFDSHPPTDNEKVQQTVAPMQANEIEKNDAGKVWGSKRGDRLIADFILVSRPVMLKTKGGN